VIDFAGLPADAKPELWTDIGNGTIVKKGGYPVLGQAGLYRVAIDIRKSGDRAADIRVQLRSGNRAFSEYVHYPIGA